MMRWTAAKTIGSYEVAAAVVLLALAAYDRSLWFAILGSAFGLKGALTLFGKGESTSWFRGEFDERRQTAVDASFRVAFLALAWWVGGLSLVAARRDVPNTLWTAGIIVALATAYVNYALTLRRT